MLTGWMMEQQHGSQWWVEPWQQKWAQTMPVIIWVQGKFFWMFLLFLTNKFFSFLFLGFELPTPCSAPLLWASAHRMVMDLDDAKPPPPCPHREHPLQCHITNGANATSNDRDDGDGSMTTMTVAMMLMTMTRMMTLSHPFSLRVWEGFFHSFAYWPPFPCTSCEVGGEYCFYIYCATYMLAHRPLPVRSLIVGLE